MNHIRNYIEKFKNYKNIIFTIAIIFILTILLLPISTFVIDFLFSLSITLSIVILMTVLFINKQLDLQSFPSILLIITMMRLALNILSTCLILSKGYMGSTAAGHIIESFGMFLIQESLVMGIIVFIILSIINFMVITKSSSTLAKVSVSFNSETVLTKQMAIDAEFSSGSISNKEAEYRKKELEDKNKFFGAIGYANKFVHGDIIASILIIFINFIVGMIIGILQHGMGFNKALDTYSILTIGGGLVAQIHALVISIAAGLLVTKSEIIESTDQAIIKQPGKYPKILIVTAGLLSIVTIIPVGMPMIPFSFLGILIGGISYLIYNFQKKITADNEIESSETRSEEEPSSQNLRIDYIRLELSGNLLAFSDSIANNVKTLRKQLVDEFGFVTPIVRIRDNLSLQYNNYLIRIKEGEGSLGVIEPNMLMVMNPTGEKIDIKGQSGKDPTFNLDVMWIEEHLRKHAISKNYTVLEPITVIMAHLTETIKNSMHELITYRSTQAMLDEISQKHKKLVSDIIPHKVGVRVIQHVLQRLLSEHISVKDLSLILEATAEIYESNCNIIAVTEHVRSNLARQISSNNANEYGHIPAISLSTKWERIFAEGIFNGKLIVQPNNIQEFINSVRSVFDKYPSKGNRPVLLTSTIVRSYIRMVLEKTKIDISILSQNEIHSTAKVRNFGVI